MTSDSLGYFIGYTLLHARRVVIVSPWLGNVDLRFPVNDHLESRHTSMLDAIDALPDTEVTLVIREGEQYNDFVRDRLPDEVTLIELDDLHAKVVVCDEFAYLGSANITRGGLTVNREVCEIIENEYDDAFDYVSAELDISVPRSDS
ncbi:phospholipase D-like domain-containing protein [Halomicrobium zhouii]|uniref:phospholipase D-like domain-containing protein n=1 Tax=Halomicrobium zhouii TaxID=767519 RepID=UPI000B7EA036|nr:phospholipase D-like domain-containing protein [Halomicrobium zhouii]